MYHRITSLKNKYIYIGLAAIGAIFFLPFLGQVHLFDWDEINFAECAREMIATGDYFRPQIDFQPFWEKPPLFIWMQVLSMKSFGISEFAARLPNAICGILTLLSVFYVGNKVKNKQTGILFALFFLISWLPHFYFKSGIIDPSFNLFIFLSFYHYYSIRGSTSAYYSAMLSGLFLGLAVLTKGPVAILIAGLAMLVYFLLNRGFKGYSIGNILIIGVASLAVIGSWFGIYILKDGWWFVNEFVAYQIRLFTTQDAGHGGPFIYHFVVLLIGCFPAVIFLFQQRIKSARFIFSAPPDFSVWMWIMLWVVLLLFSIVKTKIVHYSSLCYFPVCYLGAHYLDEILQGKTSIRPITRTLFLIVGIIWSIVLIALPLIGLFKDRFTPYIEDPFAVGNLEAQVNWSYFELIPGLIYLMLLIIIFIKLRRNTIFALGILLISQLLIIPVTILHFTPKIEAISQRAAIEFYSSFQGKQVLIKPLGFKSYAHLFYAKKSASVPSATDEDQLIHEPNSFPVYFISKIQDKPRYDTFPQLEVLGSKNGFVFYKKK